MNQIENILVNASFEDVRKFAFLWSEGIVFYENMKKFEGLSKDELIESLVEDFYWSELPESVILSHYNLLSQDKIFNNSTEQYIDFNAVWEDYNSQLGA